MCPGRGCRRFTDQGGAARSLTQPSASAQCGDLEPAPPPLRRHTPAFLMEPPLVSEGQRPRAAPLGLPGPADGIACSRGVSRGPCDSPGGAVTALGAL